jgi:hypothetical protein
MESLFLLAFGEEEFFIAFAMACSEASFNKLLIRRVNFIGGKCKIRQTESELSKESLQLGVFGFSGDEDRDVGVGVFPQREKVFVSGECTNTGGIGVRAL